MKPISHYFKVLKNESKPVKFIIAKLLPWIVGTRLIKFRRNGYLLFLNWANLSTQFFVHPERRLEEEGFLSSLVNPGDNVIDIGANIGSITISLARKIGPRGRVYAFEPHPETYKALVSNVELNACKNVLTYNVAADDKKNIIMIEDRSADDMNSIVTSGSGGISVPSLRIDHVVPINIAIKLLKVDVEGYELFAIKGCDKILGNVDLIWFECSEKHFAQYNYRAEDVFGYLNERGFAIFRKVASEYIEINATELKDIENLIAVRSGVSFGNLNGLR